MPFKEAVKKRLVQDLFDSVRAPNSYKQLIVDKRTMRILSSLLKISDLIEHGILTAELLEIKRQPLPQIEAIYYISPTEESINYLIEDFKAKKKPMYSAVHLFFSSFLPSTLMEKIAGSNVLEHIKNLKEINLEFLPIESECFILDRPESFHSLYSPEATDRREVMKSICQEIVTVCTSLQEYPIIRFASNGGVNALPRQMAEMAQALLDEELRRNPSLTTNETHERATLLILDRTHDLLAPFLHEYTYQAMCHDVLELRDGIIKFTSTTGEGKEVEREALLDDETDQMWVRLRHQHIADTIQAVTDEFNQFKNTNKAALSRPSTPAAAEGGRGQLNPTVKDLSEILRAMPQYNDALRVFSMHLTATEKCMSAFTTDHLEMVSGLEQDMATGFDTNGKEVKNLSSQMAMILKDPGVRADLKMRLLMIYVVSQHGIKEQDRRAMMNLANFSVQDQCAVANLGLLGIKLTKAAPPRRLRVFHRRKKNKKGLDDVDYELSRFQPRIKDTMEELCSHTLAETEYPYVREAPPPPSDIATPVKAAPEASTSRSARKTMTQPPSWVEKKVKKEETERPSGPRVIIFVAGGLTYSELRTAYEVGKAQKKEIIVGSTHLLTPKNLVAQIAGLKTFQSSIDDF